MNKIHISAFFSGTRNFYQQIIILRMKHLVYLLLLFFCLLSTTTYAQNSEDCVDAQPLVPIPSTTILLSDLNDITIDSVNGAGVETAEWFMDTEMDCGTDRVFFANPVDKSHWFVFSAATSGSLELLITPEMPGTTYDFALWRGGCPNDATCGELFYCNWGGNVECGIFKPTGVSTDPITKFNYNPAADNNPFIYNESIPLIAGENYYLLVQNTDEGSNLICPANSDSLGFTIQFDGTASVGPEILHQDPTPILPTPVTDTLFVCEGELQTFAVSTVQFASTYDWISKSTVDGSTITPNALGDSVIVQFGATSGQVCMEMICPIQSLICWNVNIEIVPDVAAIPNPVASCEPVDLNTRYQDNNNIVDATVNFFESEQDAINDTNPMISSIVSVSGPYWVKKTTPNGCSDIARMDILVDLISFSVVDTFRFCTENSSFFDLRALTFTNLNEAGGQLKYSFHEDSLGAVNRTMPFSPPVAFENATYWIRAEKLSEGPCYRTKKLVFLLENSPEIAPILDQDFCGRTCFQLSDLKLEDTNGQPLTGFDLSHYLSEADAATGDIANAINTEVCISGTYWVRAASSQSCFATAPFTVNFLAAPDMDDLSIDLDCVFGCVNLADQTLTEKNGIAASSLTFQYFSSLAEAENTTATPLADLNICSPTDVWVRVTNTDNSCFDVAQISIIGMPLATAVISGNNAICAGENVNLQIDFTGDAPYSVSYTDGISTFDTIAASNIFRIGVSPDTTTTYTLTAVQDGNGCVGNINGTAEIIVNQGAIITTPSQDCNATATEYTLSFDIIGTGNYRVDGIPGTLTGNTFVSDLIPSGSLFDFQVIGDDGCPPTTQPVAFSCECNSVVDVMDLQPINVCDRAPAMGNYLGPGGENLDKEDIRYFVIHDSPTNELGNVAGFKENISIFTFDPTTMQHGTIYYISAVITKADMLGNPILDKTNNPCIAVSEGVPVVFYPVPEVTLSLSNSTVCIGDVSFLEFNITGIGPYDVVFFDGEITRSLTGIVDGHTVQVSTEANTSFYVQSISQSGINACMDTPMRAANEIFLTVIGIPVLRNIETHCNKDGTKAVITFEINEGDPSTYSIYNDANFISGKINGNIFTSDSISANMIFSVGIVDANNCVTPSSISTPDGSKGFYTGLAECLCTADIKVAIETVRGVSCRGEKDAILIATPTNGAAPITYFWSTGATTESIRDVAAGLSIVTMTDNNGCQRIDSITLIEPTTVTASPNVLQPSCFGDDDGAILIVQPNGGTGEYSYSFGGSTFGKNGFRDDLPAGVYPIAIRDENNCEWTGEVTLENPSELAVSLNANPTINLGETLDLSPQINQDVISIIWESTDTSLCADCPNPVVAPITSTRYKVTVMNNAGCTASDQVLVRVKNDNLVYVPTVFSPNGDGANDLLRPFSSSAVQEISMFRVFNRWGELIYEKKDMNMVSNLEGWNGNTMSGNKAPSGVYLYFAEVSFKNGTTETLSGDVSLVR